MGGLQLKAPDLGLKSERSEWQKLRVSWYGAASGVVPIVAEFNEIRITELLADRADRVSGGKSD